MSKFTASGEGSVAANSIQYAVTGDNLTINHLPNHEAERAVLSSLASERQRLRMDMYRQALSHAEMTFRLSVFFMAGGAAVILTGAVLALLHAGQGGADYTPLITSLTGVLITGGGGALAIHANRARKHLTEQGDRLDTQIERDHKVEKLRGWIDRVVNADTRDHLNAAAAMSDMGLEPNPDAVAERVLPASRDPIGQIGPENPSGE
ncbi:hypothetical protein [Streptomyces sp. NPDC094468]|uniref:TRADD-N-associated membrane domain-containing protein n=1 Tax=Streptomyces sp. NPDC094468 TaxID=3366066 RepID=UPI0038244E64